MRKRLTAAAIAGAVGIAGLGGLAINANAMASSAPTSAATSASATADDTAPTENDSRRTGFTDHIRDALAGLVGDGTITSEQAQAVADTLAAQIPERRPGGHGAFGEPGGHHGGFGRPGMDPAVVITALVDAAQEQLDAAVAAGDVDQARADEIAADIETRITDIVQNGFAERGGPGAARSLR